MIQRTHTAEFEFPRSADRLFPLFGPEGERDWVPGWEYENIMGTTDLHEGYVFLTRNHDHAAGAAVWIVNEFDPEARRVAYYKIEPGEKLGTVTVECASLGPDAARVRVTYAYIGLSERGNRFIESFSKEAYDRFIGEWERLLHVYFQTALRQ
jgi:hypothetical protein